MCIKSENLWATCHIGRHGRDTKRIGDAGLELRSVT